MKNQITNFCIFSLITFSALVKAEPIKLIFDTDMGNDVDDALALAMLHSLESRGESELLAITLTKDNDEVAPYVDAINTFYGRGEIPIGITNSGVTPEKSRFTGVTLETDDGKFIYPHDLQLGEVLFREGSHGAGKAAVAAGKAAGPAKVGLGRFNNVRKKADHFFKKIDGTI